MAYNLTSFSEFAVGELEEDDPLPDTAGGLGAQMDLGLRAVLVSLGLLGLVALVAGLTRRELAAADKRA
jgi:hypothetical protein